MFSELADASVDFVVIDGHYRQACVLAALPKIKPGGRLLIDNSNWLSTLDWGVPSSWPLVHRSSNVMAETSIWERPPALGARSAWHPGHLAWHLRDSAVEQRIPSGAPARTSFWPHTVAFASAPTGWM